MVTVDVMIDENTLKEILINYLHSKLGEVDLAQRDVKIEVKSKQNYKSEWESAAFRATIHKTW